MMISFGKPLSLDDFGSEELRAGARKGFGQIVELKAGRFALAPRLE
jgi:hypothetical protein